MTEPPASAAEMANRLGNALASIDDLAPEHFELVAQARRLQAAIVATGIEAPERAKIATQLEAIADRLDSVQRDELVLLARLTDGRVQNLTQAGSGQLNPHAPALVFDPVIAPVEPGQAVEVVARVTLDASHSGPPAKVHGGVVATILDEVLGVAAFAAGAAGLTAGLNIRYRGGTPFGVKLVVTGRYVGSDGRKNFATGEVLVDGEITAEAEAIFIAPEG